MTPSTPSIGHVNALSSKLDEFFAEGLEARYARHRRTNQMTRDWAARNGFVLFPEYKQPLTTWAAHYARPVNVRDKALPDPRDFAQAYLTALRDQFMHIQGDYRKRRRAFDTLFKHTVYDPGGSFAYRWECTLKRLDQTNVDELVEAIRQKIVVLGDARSAPSPVGAK